MAIGVVERMLFLFVLGPLEGSSTLCGFIILVSSLCNIPVFHHAGTLLRYFGHNGCLLIAQVCYFTRVFGYTLLTPATKNCILFLEVLHDFTFATLWVASVDFAANTAPPGWSSLLQSLVSVIYYSAGPGIGALLGGWLWDQYSPRFMYRAYACAVMALSVLRALRMMSRRLSCVKTRVRSAPNQHTEDTIMHVSVMDVEPLIEVEKNENIGGLDLGTQM
eukprot:CAMPEP_0185757318 /NCGR_PEP_ID=MMETSP1174-20130828/15787_1 /TAXON_ID=35687 /ORGANISM="Dictyocha speculum, Strain CCMP1381" /LENGTH=219 /DNA_ID=CAMNT_0028436677 /DNA_START=1036 /DNA_END=1695 /DNA_ORIENTATION=-